MRIFDFLKKLFGWADESPRKRRADSFSLEEEYTTPKKQRCSYKTKNNNETCIEIDDCSDSKDIEVIQPKHSPITPVSRSNDISGNSYSYCPLPHSSASKTSFPRVNHSKLNMGYFSNKNHNTPNIMADCKCSTLSKTHRLKEKNQYEELLHNFLPRRIHILSNKPKEQPSTNEIVEVIELDKTEPSAFSSTIQQTSKTQNRTFRFSWPQDEKLIQTKEKNITSTNNKKDDSIEALCTKTRYKQIDLVTKSPSTTNIVESVPMNSLRDKLAGKAVVKDDFIPQVAKRYNEHIEQRYKEVEELKKITCVLSKHNRLAREAALEEQLAKSMRLCEVILDEREEPDEPQLPVLTEEMLREIKSALIPRPPDEVLSEGFGLRITRKDLHTLADLNWLNDEVINFYMNLLIVRGTGEKFPKVHAMNTFFYPKLISNGHSSLRRWTRKIDIFAQDLIVIPVHLGIHWCMSIIDFRDKTIRYFDSMHGSNMKCCIALKEYLEEESLDKKKHSYDTSDWKLECVKDIPQQMNGSDCGVFSCMFAEYICANRKLTFTQKDMPYFRNKMIYEILKRKLF